MRSKLFESLSEQQSQAYIWFGGLQKKLHYLPFLFLIDNQNINPKKKLRRPNTQILLLGYLPPISIEIKEPIPKNIDKMNEIEVTIVLKNFISWHIKI